MHELPVSGEIRTMAFREGSSGVLSGTIEGLYHGYRFGSTTPDEQEYTIEAPFGTIALLLRQQIVTVLPPRLEEHPFATGDPFEDVAAGRPPAGIRLGPPGGGPPGDGPPGGGPPGGGPPGGGPPGGGPPDDEEGRSEFEKHHYMEVKLHAVPEKSTGIYAGVTGEMRFATPEYKFGGYMHVMTERGDLFLNFLEKGGKGFKLDADLTVDGERSTGVYENARGELEFSLDLTPPLLAQGPYSGTIWLENEPQS